MTSHESSGRWFEEKCLLGFDDVEIKRVDIPSRATFWAISLLRISIKNE